MSNGDQQAIEAVKTHQAFREPRNIYVKAKTRCLDGTVYFMHWASEKEKREFDALVFTKDRADPQFMWSDDFVKYAAAFDPGPYLYRFLRETFNVGGLGVAGGIGLIVTVTICYLVIQGRTDVPAILANALTTILGFYFGSKVGRTTG